MEMNAFNNYEYFTRKNVLPSSRSNRNGTSESIGFRNSVQPIVVKYWALDTAHTGDLTPENENKNN